MMGPAAQVDGPSIAKGKTKRPARGRPFQKLNRSGQAKISTSE
jgi:hypothetical protein